MRVHPWIASILSVMALAVGQTGFAQPQGLGSMPGPGDPNGQYYPAGSIVPGGPGYPGGNGGFAPGGPGFPGGNGGFVPQPPVAPAGAWDPIAAGQQGGPGHHPEQMPWPHISPFENRFDEHTNERGLWFFRSDNSNRKYFANIDYRYAKYRRPDQTRVGADYNPVTLPTMVGGGQFLPLDTGVLYDSFVANLGSVNTIAVNEQSLKSEPTVNGFLLEWGYKDPTQTGLDFSVWYTPEAHWAYSRGFNPSRQSVITATNAADGRPLTVTNGLPIFDGMTVENLTFDSFFGLDFQTVSGGGDVNWSFTPIRQSSWFKIAPTAGFQATYIGEDFTIQGVDTSGTVTFDTSGLGNSFAAIPGFPRNHVLNILSEVNSYLLGPQIGLRFEFGGDELKIRGHSQVGVAVNRERLRLYGFGVGNPFQDQAIRLAGPNLPFNQDFRFEQEEKHTRLSPTTAQEIMLEAKIFSFIPGIRRIDLLEKAKFRFGYQIQAAFEIQRPHRIIQYNGLPLIPAIRNDQETRWYVESYNFGLHWEY